MNPGFASSLGDGFGIHRIGLCGRTRVMKIALRTRHDGTGAAKVERVSRSGTGIVLSGVFEEDERSWNQEKEDGASTISIHAT